MADLTHDLGNHLLAEMPAHMHVAPTHTPNGPRLMLTLRTGSTTLTVLLPKAQADEWSAAIASGASRITGLIVPNGNGIVKG